MWKTVGKWLIEAWNAYSHTQTFLGLLAGFGVTAGSVWTAWYAIASEWHPLVSAVVALSVLAIGMFLLVCITAYRNGNKLEIEQETSDDKFIPIHQVVEYVRNVIGDNNKSNCYPDTLIAIRQALLDGELKSKGKEELPNKPGCHDDVDAEIEPSYWKENKISFLATDLAHINDYHTMPINYVDGFRDQRWSLQVSKNDMLEKWSNGPEDIFSEYRNNNPAKKSHVYWHELLRLLSEVNRYVRSSGKHTHKGRGSTMFGSTPSDKETRFMRQIELQIDHAQLDQELASLLEDVRNSLGAFIEDLHDRKATSADINNSRQEFIKFHEAVKAHQQNRKGL